MDKELLKQLKELLEKIIIELDKETSSVSTPISKEEIEKAIDRWKEIREEIEKSRTKDKYPYVWPSPYPVPPYQYMPYISKPYLPIPDYSSTPIEYGCLPTYYTT